MAGHRPKPEPVVIDGRPESLPCPDHLPADGKEFWEMVVPTLALDGVDRPMLELAAVQYARAKQAGRVLAQEGHATRGVAGQLIEHPVARTERNAADLFMRFAEQYALTPVARTRLGLAELRRRSLLDDLDDELGERKVKGG